MKKVSYLILTILLFLPFVVKAKETKLYLFYRDGCPHCAKEKEYLNEIEKEYNVQIEKYEVWNSTDNSKLMDNVSASLEETINGVPYTVIGSYSTLGFNENTKKLIKEYLDICTKYDCVDVVGEVKKANKAIPDEMNNKIASFEKSMEIPKEKVKKAEDKKEEITNIPFLGNINIKKLNVPLFLIAIVMGTVDGFNPCAMWVLIFLISMMLGMKNRKRMWALGFTFLTCSAFIYFLFMVAWLKVSLEIGQIKIINLLIAFIALIGGIVNIRSYLKTRKEDSGCTVVDDKKRKSIIHRVKKLTHEKSFPLAIIGVIVLAVSVNFVELLCSAGLPVVFTRILSVNKLNVLSYYGYILLYILFYLIDDIIVFIVAMVTLKITGITNKYNKYSHLIGGLIMLIIGILLVFKPELLMFSI